MNVEPHPLGYQINILGTEISFMITHAQIKNPEFDPGQLLDEEWEDLEILDAQQDGSLGIPFRPFQQWNSKQETFGLFPFEPESEPWRSNEITVGLFAAQPQPDTKRPLTTGREQGMVQRTKSWWIPLKGMR
jgi:hypothetical protein